jgi:hypothetical protein
MTRIIRISRVAVLVGAALVALNGRRAIRAQWPNDQCITSFYTEWDYPCPNCCNNATLEIDQIVTPDNTSPGDISASLATYNCGGGTNCSGCGGGEYYEQVQDPSCCGGNGSYCSSYSDCCCGLMCLSTHICSWCVDYGGECGTDWDCCGWYCEPSSHTCQPE